MSLEAEARKEFARILTKVTRVMNGVLDGTCWGKVGQEEISTEYNANQFVCLDASVQGYRMTMHASYDSATVEQFYRARQRMGYTLVTRALPQERTPGYVIIAVPARESASVG